MTVTGIICEYNPLHLGHKKQLDTVSSADPEGGIVCLMSGNFVQRGMPALFHKSLRAQAAVGCGADLVLEMPVTTTLSSAEGFAAGGVSILSSFCDKLCFGAEKANIDKLLSTAEALLSAAFPLALRHQLDKGLSFPSARQAALEEMGLDGSMIATPNNVLAVEYCKAILSQNSKMKPIVIHRPGNYHDLVVDKENPSATAVRQRMVCGEHWQACVPKAAQSCFENQPLYTLESGERAILGRLHSMSDSEFENLPYGTEGLWRKLMHAVRNSGSLEEILTKTKSKRYTRTRLNRMVMCAFLGITQEDICTPAPYIRVLALNKQGGQILKRARKTGDFVNLGEKTGCPYQQREDRWDELYGLFCQDAPRGKPQQEVFYMD